MKSVFWPSTTTDFLMLQEAFHDEQENDKQQEHDQNPITAFVVLAVQRFVLSVYEIGGDDESNQKKHCKNELSLCKHCGYFSGKGNQSRPKSSYFAAS